MALKDHPHPEELPQAASREGRTELIQQTSSERLPLHPALCRRLYTGTTRESLERRIGEHQAGTFDGYTTYRRPVSLVFHEAFERIEDAVSAERQIKGWRREKKEA